MNYQHEDIYVNNFIVSHVPIFLQIKSRNKKWYDHTCAVQLVSKNVDFSAKM